MLLLLASYYKTKLCKDLNTMEGRLDTTFLCKQNKEYNIPTIQARESMDIPKKIHTLPSLDGRYIILFTFYPTYRESIVILSLSMGEGKVILSLSTCDL